MHIWGKREGKKEGKKEKNGGGINVELITRPPGLSSISNNIKKRPAGRWPAYYYHYVCMYYSTLIRLRFKV